MNTRRLELLLACSLTACGPDPRESLGSFVQNRKMIIASGGTMEATETAETWTCRVTPTDWTLPIGETQLARCPCRGSATLHRAANRNEVAMLQYSLQHCARQNIVAETHHTISWWIPSERRDEFKTHLERPGGDTQRPEHRKVEATHIYGDRTVELLWSRDVHRAADGSEQPGDTESIFVAVRPRKSSDKEQVRASTEAVISPTPRCR